METSTKSRRDEILADPGFGKHLTDHMVTATFSNGAWSDLVLEPLADLALSPAAMVLHYGQAIFEGLKAYRQPDGSVAMFRAGDNAARFNRSAVRTEIGRTPPAKNVSTGDAITENSCSAAVRTPRLASVANMNGRR